MEGEPGLPGPECIGQVADAPPAASQESDQSEAGLVAKCPEAALAPAGGLAGRSGPWPLKYIYFS